MKAFFERYSYESVRMLLNQIAITMFGFSLALASTQAENDTLLWVTSVASIIFYLVLAYGTAWKMGSNDKVGVEYGKRKYNPCLGVLVSLLANSINYLLAILIAIGHFGGFEGMASICRGIALLAQGMYQGVLATITIGGVTLNNFWWVYFLLPIPSILISFVAYIAGVKDIHITNMGIPEMPASDRPTRKELKEKKQQERNNRK